MANLKAIKNKIKSVGNIKQITKALEIVSTVKLKKVKDETDSYKLFLESMLEVLSLIQDKVDVFESDVQTSNKKLAIIITSEKGLCGSLNSKLLKIATEQIEPKTDIFAIGKKAIEHSKRNDRNIAEELHLQDNFTNDDLSLLQNFIANAIETGAYGHITLYYNHFHNAMTQLAVPLQLLPLDKGSLESFTTQIGVERKPSHHLAHKDITLEPSATEFKQQAKKIILQHIIYGAILQNKTGEFASRMIAMKNATDNSTNMIKDLKLSFNKARQAAITQEISEITSAKVSMES